MRDVIEHFTGIFTKTVCGFIDWRIKNTVINNEEQLLSLRN